MLSSSVAPVSINAACSKALFPPQPARMRILYLLSVCDCSPLSTCNKYVPTTEPYPTYPPYIFTIIQHLNSNPCLSHKNNEHSYVLISIQSLNHKNLRSAKVCLTTFINPTQSINLTSHLTLYTR